LDRNAEEPRIQIWCVCPYKASCCDGPWSDQGARRNLRAIDSQSSLSGSTGQDPQPSDNWRNSPTGHERPLASLCLILPPKIVWASRTYAPPAGGHSGPAQICWKPSRLCSAVRSGCRSSWPKRDTTHWRLLVKRTCRTRPRTSHNLCEMRWICPTNGPGRKQVGPQRSDSYGTPLRPQT